MTAESAANVKAGLGQLKLLYERLKDEFKAAYKSPEANREWLKNRYDYFQRVLGEMLNEAIRAYKANDFDDANTKLIFVRQELETIQSQLTALSQPAPPVTFEPVNATRIVPGFESEVPPPYSLPPVRPSMERPPRQRSGDHRTGRRKVQKAHGVIARIQRKIDAARAAQARKAAKPRHRSR